MRIYLGVCLTVRLTVLLNAFAEAKHVKSRVAEGALDIEKEFLFVVAVFYRVKRICTGNLLSEAWVMTAAHCVNVKREDSSRLSVQYAEFTSRANETKAFVQAITFYKHPGFNWHLKMLFNDIGLILTEQVPLVASAKLSAIDYKGLVGLPVKYAGFGFTGEGDSYLIAAKDNRTWNLQVGEGIINTCETSKKGIHPRMCIAPKCSTLFKYPFQGDSGGPVIYNGKIVALITGGYEKYGYRPIFTPVSSYLNWIYDVINNRVRILAAKRSRIHGVATS